MHYKVVHKISASSMKNLVRPWFFDIIIDNSKPEIWKSIEFIEIYVIEIPNLAKTELRTYNAVFDKIVWPQNLLFYFTPPYNPLSWVHANLITRDHISPLSWGDLKHCLSETAPCSLHAGFKFMRFNFGRPSTFEGYCRVECGAG